MPDRPKVMIQTKRGTRALQVGGWSGLTVENFLTIATGRKESNCKRGRGSSWPVAPEEEEGVCLLIPPWPHKITNGAFL
jgi:hypothetical protein